MREKSCSENTHIHTLTKKKEAEECFVKLSHTFVLAKTRLGDNICS